MSNYGFPFQPEPPTPEEREEMEEKQRLNEVKMDEFRHGFQRLFEELDEDQLRAMRQMLHFIVEGTGSILASNWEGMTAQAMKMRFNICVTCGVDHDRDIQPEPVPQVNEPLDTPLPNFYELTDADKELMKEYHLDDVRVEGTNELVGFACTGVSGMSGPCGQVYPSIADRMLRDAETCSGCFIRMGQG